MSCGVLREAVKNRWKSVLDSNEHEEEEEFLDDEEESVDRAGGEQAHLHERDPEEVIRLLEANRAEGHPKEAPACAHPAKRARPLVLSHLALLRVAPLFLGVVNPRFFAGIVMVVVWFSRGETTAVNNDE